jgi:membrane protease subunit HflK
MRRTFLVAGLPVAAAGLLWTGAGWCVVRPGEAVVVRRFGRVVGPAWGPGFHWGFPPGIDRLDRVRTDQVRRLNVGLADPGEAGLEGPGGEFLTGDLNLVRVQAVVQYRVDDAVDFVVRGESAEGLLRRLAEAGLSAALARRGIDAVLRGGRQAIAGEVETSLGEALRRHRTGLAVLGVSLTEARPPAEVAEAFVAAQAAENRRDRRGHEARGAAETTLTAARAEAGARLDRARSAAHRKVLASRAEARKFAALSAEAARSRPLTIRRIYLDTMKSLLSGVGRKVVLPPGEAVDLTVLGIDE